MGTESIQEKALTEDRLGVARPLGVRSHPATHVTGSPGVGAAVEGALRPGCEESHGAQEAGPRLVRGPAG